MEFLGVYKTVAGRPSEMIVTISAQEMLTAVAALPAGPVRDQFVAVLHAIDVEGGGESVLGVLVAELTRL